MTPPATMKRRRQPPAAVTESGDLQGTVSYMMGKLEGIEDRLDLTETQQNRMEAKIDRFPDVIRDAVSSMIAGFNSHGDRLDALERADAAEQGSIKALTDLRTKLFAGFVALATLAGSWWATFHK